MPQPDKVVRLRLSDGLPVPEIDPIRVAKGNQKVKWCAEFPFTIDIEGYGDVGYPGPDGDGPHNCKTGYFKDAKQYKYSISANGKVNDPTLEVEP
jgi:hypothetical protein